MLVFGSLVAAGVPLVVGGSSVLVALAAIFVVASFTPMSIFVLNLATLLGLGLGVDYSLLLTSRFREELAKRQPMSHRTGSGGRPGHGRDRRPGGVLQRPDGAPRAARSRPVRVHDPALGGDRWGHRRRFAAAALTLLPALLTLFGEHLDRLAIRRGRGGPAADGPWARLARRVMRDPVAVLIPTLAFLLLLGSPFLHVRFNSPDASIPPPTSRRARVRPAARRVRRGRVRADRGGGADDGPATDPGEPGRAVRLLPAPGRRPAGDAGRQPRRRRPAADADAVPAPVRGPEWTARPIRGHGIAATTKDDLTAFTVTTPFGRNRDEGSALVRDLRAAAGPLAPPAGTTVLVGGGAADVADVSMAWPPTSRAPRLFIIVTTYLVLFALLRSVVLPAKALIDERAVAHGELRRARLDLPGRQPVGVSSGSSPSGSSRRRSR